MPFAFLLAAVGCSGSSSSVTTPTTVSGTLEVGAPRFLDEPDATVAT
jgi:hypothetical protein